MTAATVAGLQALSVEIGPIVSVGLLSVCALLTVFAVTGLIERRNPATIGLSLRRFVIDWLKGAGVGAAYLCASVGILALLGGYRITGVAFAGQALASGLLLHVLERLKEPARGVGVHLRVDRRARIGGAEVEPYSHRSSLDSTRQPGSNLPQPDHSKTITQSIAEPGGTINRPYVGL